LNNNEININKEFDSIVQSREVDTLLESLLFLSKYYERTASKESLTVGLPMYNTQMTPLMFMLASKRIGLISKPVKRKLKDIKNLVLPCVVLTNENKTFILLNINNSKKLATVIYPEIGLGEVNIPLADLYNSNEEGMDTIKNIIIVKPAYNFEKRIDQEVLVEENK